MKASLSQTRTRLSRWVVYSASLLSCLVLLSSAVKPDTSALGDAELRRIPLKDGDRCLVSGILLDANGVALLFKGRRVTLHPDAVSAFLDNPSRYFSQLQPRGALFQEDQTWSLGIGWLVIGVWMSLGLACGAASSHIALQRGRSPAVWFAAGVAANVLALLALTLSSAPARVALPDRLQKIPTTDAPVPCPSCHAHNHPTARSCSACGHPLSPSGESEVQRV